MTSFLTLITNFLFSASIFFFLASGIFLFINGGWAVLSFIIFALLFTAYTKTPDGIKQAAEAAEMGRKKEAEAERVKRLEVEELKKLEEKVEELSSNPVNTKLLEDILDTLETLEQNKLKPLIGNVILPLLDIKPLDERVRDTVLACAQKMTAPSIRSPKIPSRLFYDAALNILQQHPDQFSLKKYALDVGRWHHSSVRPDRTVTIYDEQAIQNDIMVRLK